MRVLNVGWGFKPWRGGGVINYCEDIMKMQQADGWHVSYFFAGRHYPLINKTRLHHWIRNGINMYEIINSPIIPGSDNGNLFPQRDVNEPISEGMFRAVLEELNPDIVHIQELTGIPSSVIDIAKDEYGRNLIMSLHDYFPLCPTVKLFDSDFKICEDYQFGRKCVDCCRLVETSRSHLIKNTIKYEFSRYPRIYKIGKKFFKAIGTKETFPVKKKDVGINYSNLFKQFEERREKNITRLRKINLLVASSSRTGEIYASYVHSDNIITLHPSTIAFDRMKPKIFKKVQHPIVFGTIAGCASIPKGVEIIYGAIKKLNQLGLKDNYRLTILGGIYEKRRTDFLAINNVDYYGSFDSRNLNDILNTIDVGIVSSVWEEVYGLTGVEFLAKGIPVIGNKMGGITEYTIEKLSGWVNKSSSSFELANIMKDIILNPKQIIDLNESVLNNKSKIMMTPLEHYNILKSLYKRVNA